MSILSVFLFSFFLLYVHHYQRKRKGRIFPLYILSLPSQTEVDLIEKSMLFTLDGMRIELRPLQWEANPLASSQEVPQVKKLLEKLKSLSTTFWDTALHLCVLTPYFSPFSIIT